MAQLTLWSSGPEGDVSNEPIPAGRRPLNTVLAAQKNTMKPSLLSLLLLLVFSGSALPCEHPSPSKNPARDFITRNAAGSVIFLGRVLSVTETINEAGNTIQSISIRPSKQWRGSYKGLITVRGFTTRKGATHSCAGVFDFSARVGDQWLIFGYDIRGIVQPDSFISLKVPNGNLPTSVAKMLGRPE